ncbi:MAG: transglutaminase domain-containing protein [Candidatus Diapherotrites archaeon]|nr:transglutaminase domain-containing protein [Candidatus Diapherotrites archaeon]
MPFEEIKKSIRKRFGAKFKKMTGRQTYNNTYKRTVNKKTVTIKEKYIVDPSKMKNYLPNILNKEIKEPEEALVKLIEHFHTEFMWDHEGKAKTIEDMLKEKIGHCGGKSTLLVSALRALGIPSEIVGEEHVKTRIYLSPDEKPITVDFMPSHTEVITPTFKWWIGDNIITVRHLSKIGDYSTVLKEESLNHPVDIYMFKLMKKWRS